MAAPAPKLEDSVVYQTRGTFRAFETTMQRWLRDYGLQIAHFDVLRILWDGDGVTQNFLAEKTFVTESSLAQVLNEMQKQELVERKMDPNDRRKRIIFLLPKAMEIKADIIAATAELYGAAVKDIDPEDLKIYNAVSRKLRKNSVEEYERRFSE